MLTKFLDPKNDVAFKRTEGRVQGRAEEKLEGIKRRLRRNHSLEEIAEDTELPVQEIEKIKADLLAPIDIFS